MERYELPVNDLIARYEAGESTYSLASAYDVCPSTIRKRILAAGGTMRPRAEATAKANAEREHGPSVAQGQVTANRKLRARKQRMVEEYRRVQGCQHCRVRHPAALDLHHRNPADKHSCLRKQQQRDGYRKGSSGRGWVFMSFADIEAEFEKCIVLCSNCHRIEEWEARQRAAS